jgi:xanthine dehydrogenase molybdopterin-binding subunit B
MCTRRLGAGEPRRHRDGAGLNTKVAQVVAHELGIALSTFVRRPPTRAKVANTSATAASTGSDLNGKAGKDAARQIRLRLGRVRRRRVRRSGART